MRRGKITIGLGLAAIALMAAGCSEVKPDDDYQDSEDLQDAVNRSGGDCETSSKRTGVNDSSVLYCQSEDLLLSFHAASDIPSDLEEISERRYAHYLISDTWIIASDSRERTEDLQESLGGEITHRSPLADAVENCQRGLAIKYDEDYDVATISGANLAFAENPTEALECLEYTLPIPEHVQNDIGRTRALDGTREASWENYEASWTYHPDSGTNIQIQWSID